MRCCDDESFCINNTFSEVNLSLNRFLIMATLSGNQVFHIPNVRAHIIVNNTHSTSFDRWKQQIFGYISSFPTHLGLRFVKSFISANVYFAYICIVIVYFLYTLGFVFTQIVVKTKIDSRSYICSVVESFAFPLLAPGALPSSWPLGLSGNNDDDDDTTRMTTSIWAQCV